MEECRDDEYLVSKFHEMLSADQVNEYEGRMFADRIPAKG